jgi:hypothetical protein
MSEDSYKRRLRFRKRKITTTLEAQGYRVRTFEEGPFHLMAFRGQSVRAIRICFSKPDASEERWVIHEPVPLRCTRETWTISSNGRVTVFARIR